MEDELILMKNLGKTSVQLLNAVGIRSSEELRRRGAVCAYQAICSRGFHPSRALLYAIEGALLNSRWQKLPPEVKAFLRQQADGLL